MDEKIIKGDTFVERRQHPRLPVKIAVQYQKARPDDAGSKHGETHNLGAGGIAVRSDKPLPLQEYITLDLFIPKMAKRQTLNFMQACPEEECRKISVLGRVVWCSPFEDKRYLVGFQFVDLKKEDADYLHAFLLDFKLPEPKPIDPKELL